MLKFIDLFFPFVDPSESLSICEQRIVNSIHLNFIFPADFTSWFSNLVIFVLTLSVYVHVDPHLLRSTNEMKTIFFSSCYCRMWICFHQICTYASDEMKRNGTKLHLNGFFDFNIVSFFFFCNQRVQLFVVLLSCKI